MSYIKFPISLENESRSNVIIYMHKETLISQVPTTSVPLEARLGETGKLLEVSDCAPTRGPGTGGFKY